MEGLKKDSSAAAGIATASAELARLEQLDDFRLVREIGRGGMGVVYEAQQLSLGRRVALKLLPSQLHLTPRQLARFDREARTAANLHHTNIVPIFGVGEDAGYHYYVMQFIPGLGLDRVLANLSTSGVPAAGDAHRDEMFDASTVASSLKTRPGQPPAEISAKTEKPPAFRTAVQESILRRIPTGDSYWNWVAAAGTQAAGALDYAHRQGTLHRDVKPANLLLDDQGVVWVADFGLAKAVQQEDVTRSGELVGTLRYMAPEQLRGEADARSDVYGLGLTLYELATHQAAFSVGPGESLLRKVLESTPIAPIKRNPDIPRDLATIIQKAIAHEPQDRYDSAAAFADDLQHFLRQEPILARPVGPVERLVRWGQRNRGVAGLSGTIVALLVLVALVAGAGAIRTRRANQELTAALARVQAERRRSDATAELALETLDRVYERFSPPSALRSVEGKAGESDESGTSFIIRPALSAETARLLESLLTFYDRLAQQGGDSAALRRRIALANLRIGEIRERLGHHEQAEAALIKAANLYRELANEPFVRGVPPEDIDLESARVFNQLGSVYRANHDHDAASEAHLSALDLLNAKSAVANDSRERPFQIARTCYLLGSDDSQDIARRLGPQRDRLHQDPFGPPEEQGHPPHEPDRQQSQDRFLRDAIAILDKLLQSEPREPRSRHLLACCWRDLSPSLHRDDRGDARRATLRAQDLLQKLVLEYPQTPEYRLDLATTYGIRRPDDRAAPDEYPTQIEDDFLESHRLLSQLVEQHPSEPGYLVALVRIEHKLAQYYGFQGRIDDSVQRFEETLSRQSELISQFPGTQVYRAWKSAVQLDLAEVLLAREGEPPAEDVRTLIDSSIALLESALDEEPESPPMQGNLARAWKAKADVCRAEGRDADAQVADDKARDYERRARPERFGDSDAFPPPREFNGFGPPHQNDGFGPPDHRDPFDRPGLPDDRPPRPRKPRDGPPRPR